MTAAREFGWLAFVNAFDLALSLIVCAILVRYLVRHTDGWRDLAGRTRKALRFSSFGGGPYDLVIALFVVFLGILIRSETAWEYRAFVGGEIRNSQLLIGITIKAIGAACLVRVAARPKHFHLTWTSAALVMLAFAFWSAWP